MSGATSGLRVTCWKIAPASPSAPPASRQVSARGSRSSSTMKLVAWSPAPTRAAITSSSGIGELAERDADHEREQRHGGERGRDAERAHVDPQRRPPAAQGDPPAAHSATSRRRRTSQMKNGAPSSAVTMPTSSSAGRAITRPTTSPVSSTDRAEHDAVRDDPAVVRADDAARDVGDGEPDERDGAGGGHRAAGEQHEAGARHRADAADVLAERARHVVAERQRVQPASRAEGDDDAGARRTAGRRA